MTGRNSVASQTRQHSDGTCQWCGKVSWRDRKAARKVARARGSLSVYTCQLAPEYVDPPWHTGTAPAALKTGKVEARDVVANRTHRLRT